MESKKEDNQFFIFVMERNFVLVGIPEQNQENFIFWNLTKCGIIRIWGTTNGQGELAFDGPTNSTILDIEPDGTEISKKATYRKIPCTIKASKKWLSLYQKMLQK